MGPLKCLFLAVRIGIPGRKLLRICVAYETYET